MPWYTCFIIIGFLLWFLFAVSNFFSFSVFESDYKDRNKVVLSCLGTQFILKLTMTALGSTPKGDKMTKVHVMLHNQWKSHVKQNANRQSITTMM